MEIIISQDDGWCNETSVRMLIIIILKILLCQLVNLHHRTRRWMKIWDELLNSGSFIWMVLSERHYYNVESITTSQPLQFCCLHSALVSPALKRCPSRQTSWGFKGYLLRIVQIFIIILQSISFDVHVLSFLLHSLYLLELLFLLLCLLSQALPSFNYISEVITFNFRCIIIISQTRKRFHLIRKRSLI